VVNDERGRGVLFAAEFDSLATSGRFELIKDAIEG
jgi:hypothetical protein